MDTELKQQFDEIGVEPSDAVLDKCMELAISYGCMDATEFVEQWMAFSLSHLHGDEPTPENLGEFERKVLQLKKEKVGFKTSTQKTKTYAPAPVADTSSLSTYGLIEDDPMMDDYVSESVTDSSMMHTPKSKKDPSSRSSALKGGVLFSPASYTPQSAKRTPASGTGIGTPSTTTVAGKPGDTVDTFGHPKLLTGTTWQAKVDHALSVSQKLLHQEAPLTLSNLSYMNDLLCDKCDDLEDRLEATGRALVEKKLSAEEVAEISWYPQDGQTLQALHKLYAVGMIHSEDDGPLDAYSSFMAVTDGEECSYLELNFTRLKSASIFPGQVVLAKGFIPKGTTFVVEEMHTERKLTPPSPLRVDRELQFVVAAGPYTHSTDMFYDPLQDLLKYLKDHRPDVLVLVGPFVEASHKLVGEMAETFDSFFEKMIAGIMEVVGAHTTVLMVSSQKDAMTHAIYPTPPPTLRRTYPNLHLLPDPSIVDLDGITVGVTSTDVVDHLLSHEFAVNGGERMHRAINHLFNQGSFYPMYPPADEDMAYDSQLALKYAQLRQLPNILLLPGDQRHFIRLVSDCLVINPGRLADNKGGTFARFLVTPTAPTATGKAASLFNSVACQVQRI
ncbi:DNA polymerase alpha subunit B [Drosophila guanche]|uniref:DNA polymerase alpha subunit B n=1 Tax=Drosophila guanche TaxID=7266 RepID=A0A3B0JF39_DROGU|nr:DNA polymerase alpha subunit B [Drosophila guanche]SPP80994.1 blast:DNA polymerase alpha subunit B [Drosophila guanche]